MLSEAIRACPVSKDGKPMLLIIDYFSNLMKQKGDVIEKIKYKIITEICDLSSWGYA